MKRGREGAATLHFAAYALKRGGVEEERPNFLMVIYWPFGVSGRSPPPPRPRNRGKQEELRKGYLSPTCLGAVFATDFQID